jgi:SagB-type dehydrogenase family enzyme
MMDYTSAIYHNITSYDRRAMEPHSLDWRHQPTVYKVYSGAKTVDLENIGNLYAKALGAICRPGDPDAFKNIINPSDLSEILLLAGGLTGRQRQAGQDFYYRSAPSAGALYPNEIYIAWWAGGGMESGVYHFGVHNRRLSLLRPGNFRSLAGAAVHDGSSDLAAVFMITGIFFRSAWKYRKRAYRYVLMDAGHLAENLRLAINAAEIASSMTYDMDDAALDHLLGLDPGREGVLCGVRVYGGASEPAEEKTETIDALPESIRSAGRVSAAEIVYPDIAGMHAASRMVRGGGRDPIAAFEAAALTRTGSHEGMLDKLGVMPESWLALDDWSKNAAMQRNTGGATDREAASMLDFAEAVIRRRSRRNFTDQPMARSELSHMLDLLCRASGESETGRDRVYVSSVVTGFLAGNIEGVDSGFYLLDPKHRRFGKVAENPMTGPMSRVCLDQEWLARAAVHFLFISRPPDLDARWGARGYRYAMMTAGRLGQVVYLGATALGLGCCGIGALYDHEARDLLGLSPESALLYLVAAGPVKGFDRHS